MLIKKKWPPLIGNLLFSLVCQALINGHHVYTLQSTASDKIINNRNTSKPVTNSNDTNGVDEILKDTLQLLDSLEQRLDVVGNKTSDKRLQNTARMLNVVTGNNKQQVANGSGGLTTSNTRSLEEERRLTSLAEGFSSERRPLGASAVAAANDVRGEIDPLFVASSDLPQQQQQQQGSAKRARQLISVDEPATAPTQPGVGLVGSSSAGLGRFTDNDFTEKHISFSLDLMRAVFSSQSYTSKSNAIDSFLISPVSIQMVLMMMHLGSRGQTRRELSNCLHLVTPATNGAAGFHHKDENKLVAIAVNSNSSSSHNLAGVNQNNNAKLSRRHQQPAAAASSSNPKQTATSHHHQQQQQQQAASFRQATATQQNNNNLLQQIQQGNNVHEQFGSAMRQLLKDQTVVKALSSANQIFLQKDLPLLPQYEWAVKNYYGTDLKLVDFQNQYFEQQPQQNRSSANSTSQNGNNNNNNNLQLMINDWVERQTKGKISNFLTSPVPSSTLLMALNVLFFKGDWQYKFDPADTDPDAWFTLTNGRTVKVPMMVNKLPLAHAHDPAMKASLIELPYKAQRLGLFILLPDEVNGIFETMQLLNPSSFANLISMMRKPSVDPHGANAGINVRIPKFTIESSPRMSQILSQQLGLKTLFTPNLADLSGMFNPKRATTSKHTNSNQTTNTSDDSQPAPVQVGLDELLHKAVLQVHEQGSVAAAASATIVERVGLFNGQYFEADHPFLLFLMDKQTGLVLFSGVFAGPPGSGQDDASQTGSSGQHDQHHGNTGGNLTFPLDGNNQLAGRSLKQATDKNTNGHNS